MDGTGAATLFFVQNGQAQVRKIHVKQRDTSFLHSKYGP